MAKNSFPLLQWCRTWHRRLGLLAGIYFLTMAVSGVLLNHPQLIAGVDLPRAWLPGAYEFANGNRNALRGVVAASDGSSYWYGEAGVWRQAGAGAELVPVHKGLPWGAYYRDLRAVVAVSGTTPYLLAATRGGLFALREGAPARWVPVALGNDPSREADGAVVDVVDAGGRILALTRSRIYAAPPVWPPRFQDVTPARQGDGDRLPLFRFIFHAHSGEVWGLPGRLVVDALGLALVFFCVSGLAFWWGRRRKTLARGTWGQAVRGGLRRHVRWGLWLALPLLAVTLTGFFQRPPFLIAVIRATYPAAWHPAPRPANPWHDLLRKAAYDADRDQLLLATADGFFRGPADCSQPFVPTVSQPPVSVMGASVFYRQADGLYWVGSMSGLFAWDPASGWVMDGFTGRPPVASSRGPVGEVAVSGVLRPPAGEPLIVDYFRGAIDRRGRAVTLPTPAALRDGGRISLWHVLFEFHNGRLFGFLLGTWTWLLVPLGGLALTAILVSGGVSSLSRRRG